MLEGLRRDYTRLTLASADRVLLDYAVKLTREPAAVREADLAPLRAAGWSDSAVLDLNLVVAYYNFVNRLAQGLGVELEGRWGQGTAQSSRGE